MKRHFMLASAALVMTIAYSSSALAERHRFEFTGEAIGRDQAEAEGDALREAEYACYSSWGRADQTYTVLELYPQPGTGYWYAKVSVGCTVDD